VATTSCDGTPTTGDSDPDAAPSPSVATVLDNAPTCDSPRVYDILRELWIDENGVGHAMQVTRISDAFEFRYDRVRDKRYCNVSIFVNGRQVEILQPDGRSETRLQNESRVGYTITNHPDAGEFTVEVTPGWLPHVDDSFTPAVSLALAQRPEVCEQMLRDYAADPNNAPYLWTLEEPGIDCDHASRP
jgi:hypothetical protein